MGMFSRKGATQRSQPQSPTVGSSAHIAAASAFMRNTPSMGSISASAAAAALRSQTSSPEPIANLQTKRMIRKASMTSLNGYDRPSADVPRLVRRSSSSSMAERSFRSPSPGPRPAPSPKRPRGVPADRDAPPVPAVPAAPAVHTAPKRVRAASLDPPQRIQSPTPGRKTRNMSVDRGAPHALALSQLTELEREESTHSTNYSRPIASPTNSQPTSPSSPIAPRAEHWPTTARDISSATTNGTSADSARKKKKKPSTDGATDTPPSITSKQSVAHKTPALVSGLNAKKSAPPTVNTDVEPPQRDTVEPLSSVSPRTTRPTNTLVKQPSMVREEPENEDAPPRQTQVATSTPKVSAKKKKRPVQVVAPTPPVLAISQTNALATGRTRKDSLEVPSPSLRFDNNIVDASTGPRHEPSRAASPAKSALKHSPASSIRTSSPVAPSDSDAASFTARKRVSFETDRIGSPSAATRRSVSPSPKDEQGPPNMKERPELPTFGSVKRGDRSPQQRRVTPTSPLASLGNDTSSDAVVGAVLVEAASPKTAESLGPDAAERDLGPQAGSSEISHVAGDSLTPLAVPDISVQPATPGLVDVLPESAPVDQHNVDDDSASTSLSSPESTPPRSSGAVVTETRSKAKRLSTASDASDTGDEFSDAAESPDDMEGGVFASLDAIVESPIRTIKSTSSPVARPDETPATPQDWKIMTAYWKSLTKAQREKLERQAAAEEQQEAAGESDTDTLRPTPEPTPEKELSHAISEEPAGSPKKKKMKPKSAVVPAPPPASVAKNPEALAKVPTKSSSNASRSSSGSRRPPRPIVQTEPKKSALKKTMRETSPDPVHMKTTMRPSSVMSMTSLRDRPDAGSGRPASASGMRMSLRDGAPPSRPVSMQQTSLSGGTLRSKKQPPMSVAGQTALTNNDSDSESSFRRKRRTSGGHSMRLSMREQPGPASRGASPPARGSWSVRSMSPDGSAPRPAFRSSMRASSVDPGPTMRGNNSRARARDSKSPSRFSLSMPFGSGPKSAGPGGSRFADSDSEDDIGVSRPAFSSRVLDSSDDEPMAASPEVASPATMRSMRSLPSKTKKGRMSNMLSRHKDDSDSDAQSPVRRRPSMVSLRGTKDKSSKDKAKASAQNQVEINKAMEAAQRNVNAMLGKPPGEASNAKSTEARLVVNGAPSSETSAPALAPSTADAVPVSPTPTMTRRTSMLGGLFRSKRTESMTEVPTIALHAGSPSTPTMEAQPQFPPAASSPGTPLSAKSKRGKLQRRTTPALQRLDSNRLGAAQPGTSGPESAVLSGSSGGSTMRNWPLPKLPFTSHVRANSLDAAQQQQQQPKKPPTERTLSLIMPSREGQQQPLPMSEQSMTAIDGDRKKRFGKLRKVFGRS